MREPGPDLGRHNRQVLARRTAWPAGTLAECERLDATHPGWSVCWWNENRGQDWERPAGYAAQLGDEWVFGPSVAELEQKIAVVETRIAKQRTAEERQWASMRGVAAAAKAGEFDTP